MGFDANFTGQPLSTSTERPKSRISLSKAQSSDSQVPKKLRGLESKFAADYVILWIKLDTKMPCKFPESVWNLANSLTQSKDKFAFCSPFSLFYPIISSQGPGIIGEKLCAGFEENSRSEMVIKSSVWAIVE